MAIARTRPLAGPAPHPGEVLKDELEARGVSAHALALALRLPASRISQIVRSQRAITPETALRLARYFYRSGPLSNPSPAVRPRPRELISMPQNRP